MKNLRTLVSIFLLSTLIIYGVGCSDKKSPSKIQEQSKFQLDPILVKISASAAMMQFNILVGRSINCLLAQTFSSTNLASKTAEKVGTKRSLLSDSIVKDIADEYSGLCQAYVFAEEETKTTFDEIKKNGKLSEKQFAFSIFDSKSNGEEGAFSENEVGLFSTVESCSKTEQYALGHGVPVRRCREWRDFSSLR